MNIFHKLLYVALLLGACWACSSQPARWQGEWKLSRIENRRLQQADDLVALFRWLGVDEAQLVAWLIQGASRQLSLHLYADGRFEIRFVGGLRLLQGRWSVARLPRRIQLVFRKPFGQQEQRVSLRVRMAKEHMLWHNFDQQGSVISLRKVR